ncbi:MAG: leucyl/phenylalanyl-tRNA--protein transferase [Geminicoccaceae bacterium]
MVALTPELLLGAYQAGIFPMADEGDQPTVHWIDPRRRGVIPLDAFHVPRSLQKTLRRGAFELRCDTDFRAVITACAEPTEERERTWLNRELIDLYCRVHQLGCAHSVEAWQEGRLVGGLYGIHLGAAYFGESMFSRVRDASKVALVELVGRLRAAGFKLLDTQFVTDHLTTFGCIEISRAEYRRCLAEALRIAATFPTDAGVYWGLALGTGSSGGGSGSVFSNCGSAHSTTQTS